MSHAPLTGDRQVVNNSHTPLTGDRRRQCRLCHSRTGRRGSTLCRGCCPCGRCAAKYFPAKAWRPPLQCRQWSFHCLGDTNTCGIRYGQSMCSQWRGGRLTVIAYPFWTRTAKWCVDPSQKNQIQRPIKTNICQLFSALHCTCISMILS